MKNLIIFNILILVATVVLVGAKGHSTNSYEITDNTQVLWPKESKLSVNWIPNRQGLILTCIHEKENCSIKIRKQNTREIASMKIAKEYWQESLRNQKLTKDLGCAIDGKKLNCQRIVNDNGYAIYEKLVWTGNNDLFILKASSNNSQELASNMLSQLQFLPL